MFDDTFRRIPSEGWMFLPLVNYEGGGPAAWFEPLNLHRTEYDFAFAQYFGAGVQGTSVQFIYPQVCNVTVNCHFSRGCGKHKKWCHALTIKVQIVMD